MNLKTVLYLFFIEDKLQKTVIPGIFFRTNLRKHLLLALLPL